MLNYRDAGFRGKVGSVSCRRRNAFRKSCPKITRRTTYSTFLAPTSTVGATTVKMTLCINSYEDVVKRRFDYSFDNYFICF